jgi:hypothetical protein
MIMLDAGETLFLRRRNYFSIDYEAGRRIVIEGGET